jgi:hypothetical protein
MKQFCLTSGGCLVFGVSLAVGCGGGVSSSNIAQFSRTRLPEELDSATVIVQQPPPAAVVPAASPPQATPVRAAPAPSPAGPTVAKASAPLVIDADDPTPIPSPAPVPTPPPPSRSAIVSRPGQPLVIDADDPTPTMPTAATLEVRRDNSMASATATANSDSDSAERDVQRALAALNLLQPRSNASKLPLPPTEPVQKEVKARLRELYTLEIKAATTPAGWQALCRQLMQDAERMQTGGSEQYVMLTIASEIALKQGDLATAAKALDRVQADFDTVLMEPRLEILRVAGRTVGRGPANKHRFLADGDRLIRSAVERNDFAAAKQAQKAIAEIVRRWGDPRLNARLAETEAELDSLARSFEPVPGAAETLHRNAHDAAASQILGWYLCCVRNCWDEGLPLLTRGDDVRWRLLATFELSNKSAKQMVQLADEWWDMSDKAGPAGKRNLLFRARHWYTWALSAGATDLEALRAERQLQVIGQSLGHDGLPGGAENSSPVPPSPVQTPTITAD